MNDLQKTAYNSGIDSLLNLKDPLKVKSDIVDFISEKVYGNAVVGISGGLDSAIIAYLSVAALGPGRTHGVYMPSKSNTVQDMEDACLVANILGIKMDNVPIDDIVDSYEKNCSFFEQKLSKGNLKARIRMSILYGLANSENGMVVGTSNKTEMLVGYFTKYGDGGVDIEPIADLYKTQTRVLAKEIGVPQQIITKAPSAGLWPEQTDEGELGISYEQLDRLLAGIELGYSNKAISEVVEIDLETIDRIKNMVKHSGHKRSMPPSPELIL